MVYFKPPDPIVLPPYAQSDAAPELPIPKHPHFFKKLEVGVSPRTLVSREDKSTTGSLCFFKIPSRKIVKFIDYLTASKVTNQYKREHLKEINATGGGAYKYAAVVKEKLNITLCAKREMECLIKGLNFLLLNGVDEIFRVNFRTKEQIMVEQNPNKIFPYIVVNCGSGVSILKVTGKSQFERISGTSLGGGTFWGLCKLLTNLRSWHELDEIKNTDGPGDNKNVDLLVGDIYGGRDIPDIGLSKDVIASSFGKAATHGDSESEDNDESEVKGRDDADSFLVSCPMCGDLRRRTASCSKRTFSSADEPRRREHVAAHYKSQDITKSLLFMISNNIGQISYLNAKLHKVNRIIFCGGFIQDNPYVWSRLSYSIDFWSKSEMQALFPVHDGYLGALGALLA
eukprot:TRINITY_DN2140_c0_g1_i1.p1 TRINITY_DN2140_c0_g1~~TRINITY_DN2140_c0_g1_i1.p1  ORF type:complete len:455 (+),score=55.59 TRINITY_DN2140_c0_g1_i1:171-1367(+)